LGLRGTQEAAQEVNPCAFRFYKEGESGGEERRRGGAVGLYVVKRARRRAEEGGIRSAGDDDTVIIIDSIERESSLNGKSDLDQGKRRKVYIGKRRQ
jgi:hypothetical protein